MRNWKWEKQSKSTKGDARLIKRRNNGKKKKRQKDEAKKSEKEIRVIKSKGYMRVNGTKEGKRRHGYAATKNRQQNQTWKKIYTGQK